MAAEREWYVRVVLNLIVIGRRKAIWVELFWVIPIPYMVMQHVRVHHNAGFGGNVVAAQSDFFIGHACDCWLWWMQTQSLLACLLEIFKLGQVFVLYGASTAKNFVNFSQNSKE